MGTFTFKWPYDANEVFVTGTFDDWGKTVRLDRVSDGFAKEVSLPIERVQYKFVVDGIWTTDSRVREETDGHNNVNNVLLPEEIQDPSNPAPAIMSGVTPNSTTAALAAEVPKEKTNGDIPGSFPETPGQESEQIFSVNPIPASGGHGNPIKLNPGEKVPDLSSIHGNTVDSTVKLDKESYEKGDSVPLGSAGTQNDTASSSAFAVPPVTRNLIPESSLPMGGPAQRAAMDDQQFNGGPAQQAADPGYTTIQSAAPTSTTAALAAEVPLEKNRQSAADHDYTTQSAAPTSTTAALAGAVPLESSKQTNGSEPANNVPEIVKESIADSEHDPEAAANKVAVEEKKEMEHELQKKVDVNESAGTPAPTVSAATQPTAPGVGAGLATPGFDSADVSPLSTPPPGRSTGPAPTSTGPAPTSTGPAPTSTPATVNQTAPVVTDGPVTVPTDTVSTPKPAQQTRTNETAGTTTTSEGSSKDDKKKKRRSWFSKLKEKLK